MNTIEKLRIHLEDDSKPYEERLAELFLYTCKIRSEGFTEGWDARAKIHRSDKMVTTLDFLDKEVIKSSRRSGNTTRLADLAIQMLFNGKTIRYLDHHALGSNKRSNEELLRVILRRLSSEHGIDASGVVVDTEKQTIYLTPY